MAVGIQNNQISSLEYHREVQRSQLLSNIICFTFLIHYIWISSQRNKNLKESKIWMFSSSPSCLVSWACTPLWFWSSASLCASSSVAFPTPSCSRSCPTWTASSSCAPISSWCERRGSWTWRRTCTLNSSSFTARQRLWSSGLGRKLSEGNFNEWSWIRSFQRHWIVALLVWAAILASKANEGQLYPHQLSSGGSDTVLAPKGNTFLFGLINWGIFY